MLRVAHLSTFPPLQCGIAQYAHDMVSSLRDVRSTRFPFVYNRNVHSCHNHQVLVTELSSFSDLANAVNDGAFDVVDLQHEFGIWGGAEGEGLPLFLERCRVPIAATLHTTFSEGRSNAQTQMLVALCQRATRLVVLTEASCREVLKLHPACQDKITVVRHGVPAVEWRPRTHDARGKEDAARPMEFISPGFFRPDKGYEVALEACVELLKRGREFTYKIAGSPQPQFPAQILYKNRIEKLVGDLGLAPFVTVQVESMSQSDLLGRIVDADCCVTPYTDVRQNSTGVVPWVLGCGRVVVATPIEYALCTKDVAPGIFVAERVHHLALCDAMEQVIANRESIRRSLMPEVYRVSASWRWPNAAALYRRVFEASTARKAIGSAKHIKHIEGDADSFPAT